MSPSITLNETTPIGLQTAPFFEQEKFKGHGKRGGSGYLKREKAITSSAASYERLGDEVFLSCSDQVNASDIPPTLTIKMDGARRCSIRLIQESMGAV